MQRFNQLGSSRQHCKFFFPSHPVHSDYKRMPTDGSSIAISNQTTTSSHRHCWSVFAHSACQNDSQVGLGQNKCHGACDGDRYQLYLHIQRWYLYMEKKHTFLIGLPPPQSRSFDWLREKLPLKRLKLDSYCSNKPVIPEKLETTHWTTFEMIFLIKKWRKTQVKSPFHASN